MDVYILAVTVANSGFTLSFCAGEKLFFSCARGGSVDMFDVFWKPLEAARLTVAAKSMNKVTKLAVSLAISTKCSGQRQVFGPNADRLESDYGLSRQW